ncbi:MAG: hypothetical protein IV093_15535 [Rubrivivax sp.]|nr:hypothetical protein [Rubrivivax sp.]
MGATDLRRPQGRGLLLLLAATLVACGGGGSGQDSVAVTASGALVPPADKAGRLLASNCYQCHGTGGMGGFERIRGGEVDEVHEYRALASRPGASDIMAAHAQGYTDQQIQLIINYLRQ